MLEQDEELEAYVEKLGIKKNSKSPGRNQIDLQDGDNRKFLANTLEIARLDKIDSYNAEEVTERVVEYFNICQKNDAKPNIVGLALSLGFSRSTFTKILNGQTKRSTEIVETLTMAMTIINAQMEDYMLNGKINPVSGIFLMKNNFGYKDQTDVIVAKQETEEISPDKLIEQSVLIDCEDVTEEKSTEEA